MTLSAQPGMTSQTVTPLIDRPSPTAAGTVGGVATHQERR